MKWLKVVENFVENVENYFIAVKRVAEIIINKRLAASQARFVCRHGRGR
ncbi:MAG: hypothetical protein FWH08_00140 [Oscillospiraceae bacterium]|nr:hypothetical protein [Oscillospiraceae bacterium]